MGFTFGSTNTGGTSGGFSFGGTSGSTSTGTTGGGFSFGSTGQSTGGSTGGGFSFGSSANTGKSTGGGFGFGSTSTGAAKTGGFSFGGTSTGTGGGFSFGGGTTGGFGSFGNQQQQQQQQQQAVQAATLAVLPSDLQDNALYQLQRVQQQLHPSSFECRFQRVLYNKVRPGEVRRYRKPDHANARLWRRAVQNNPDPNTLVPVLLTGFDQLKQRIQVQQKARAALREALSAVVSNIGDAQKESEDLRSTLASVQAAQEALRHRLLEIMRRLAALRCKGSPLQPEEVHFARKVSAVQKEIFGPQKLRARVDEVRARARLQLQRPLLHTRDLASLSEESQRALFAHLIEQQRAIDVLVGTLAKRSGDAEVAKTGLERAALFRST